MTTDIQQQPELLSPHVYSPSQDVFLATAARSLYEAAGSWPSDVVSVSEDDFLEFGSNNRDKNLKRSFADGKFSWVPR